MGTESESKSTGRLDGFAARAEWASTAGNAAIDAIVTLDSRIKYLKTPLHPRLPVYSPHRRFLPGMSTAVARMSSALHTIH